MMQYSFDMPIRTFRALSGWVVRWDDVLSIPGTTIIPAAFSNNLIPDHYSAEAIRNHLSNSRQALEAFEILKSKAKIHLTRLTDKQVESLYWCMLYARTGHGAQASTLRRLADIANRYHNRSPLIKLAECADG